MTPPPPPFPTRQPPPPTEIGQPGHRQGPLPPRGAPHPPALRQAGAAGVRLRGGQARGPAGEQVGPRGRDDALGGGGGGRAPGVLVLESRRLREGGQGRARREREKAAAAAGGGGGRGPGREEWGGEGGGGGGVGCRAGGGVGGGGRVDERREAAVPSDVRAAGAVDHAGVPREPSGERRYAGDAQARVGVIVLEIERVGVKEREGRAERFQPSSFFLAFARRDGIGSEVSLSRLI